MSSDDVVTATRIDAPGKPWHLPIHPGGGLTMFESATRWKHGPVHKYNTSGTYPAKDVRCNGCGHSYRIVQNSASFACPTCGVTVWLDGELASWAREVSGRTGELVRHDPEPEAL